MSIDVRMEIRKIFDSVGRLKVEVEYLLAQGRYQEAMERVKSEGIEIWDRAEELRAVRGVPDWFPQEIRREIIDLKTKVENAIRAREEEEKRREEERLRDEANRRFEYELQKARDFDSLIRLLLGAPSIPYLSPDICLSPVDLVSEVLVGEKRKTKEVLSQLKTTENDIIKVKVSQKILRNLKKYDLTPEERAEWILKILRIVGGAYETKIEGDAYETIFRYEGKWSRLDHTRDLEAISEAIESTYSSKDIEAYMKRKKREGDWMELYEIALNCNPLPFMSSELERSIEQLKEKSGMLAIEILAEKGDLETIRKLEKTSHQLPLPVRAYLLEKRRELEIEAYRKTIE